MWVEDGSSHDEIVTLKIAQSLSYLILMDPTRLGWMSERNFKPQFTVLCKIRVKKRIVNIQSGKIFSDTSKGLKTMTSSLTDVQYTNHKTNLLGTRNSLKFTNSFWSIVWSISKREPSDWILLNSPHPCTLLPICEH